MAFETDILSISSQSQSILEILQIADFLISTNHLYVDIPFHFDIDLLEIKNLENVCKNINQAIEKAQNDAKIKDKNDLLNTIAYPNQKNLLNSEILLDNKNIYMNIMENFKNFKKEYIKNKDLNEK